MDLFDEYFQNKCSKLVANKRGTHLAVCDSHHDEQSGVLAVDQFEVLIFHEGTLGRAEVKVACHTFRLYTTGISWPSTRHLC